MKKLFLTSFIIILLGNGVIAQSVDKAKLDKFFDRLSEKNKAMGSLLIVKNGETQYARSVGYTNADTKTPASAYTRYRIGSITKMFTATLIFQLVEEGKLKLTDKLSLYFPQVPNADKMTIAHILAHRSGIHNLIDDREFRTWRDTGKSKEDMLALVAKSTPDFEPDAKYNYSNIGYFVLAYVVEKVTGQPYEKTLNDRIIGKTGLKDTYVATGSIDATKNESLSYRYGINWQKFPETHPSLLFGSGSLVSTPADLSRFAQALFEGKLISPKNLSLMIENKMAMDTFQFAGKTFYGHTGGVDGFGAWLAYLPEEKLALTYATNGKVYPVSNIMNGVADIYYNKRFKIPDFDAFYVSPEVLDQYVGVYSLPGAPVKFTISRDGETLLALPPNAQQTVALEATAENKFKVEPPGIYFEFDLANKQMIIRRNGGERILTKEN